MILDYINKTFNNREIALISYLILFVFWTLTQKKIRKSIGGLVKTLFAWKISLSILILIFYVLLIVYGLAKVEFWDKTLIKDTIYWTFGVAFIIMINFDKALKDEDYFKNIIKDNFKLVVVIQFLVGLYVFEPLTEFIMMPFLIFFSLLLAYTEVYKEYDKIRNVLEVLFGILGVIYILFSGYHIYLDFKKVASLGKLKAFTFPILMTILFVPFGYVYAMLIFYESLFVRLGFSLKDNRKLRRYAKRRIIIYVNLSMSKMRRITPGFLFGGCETKDDIKKELNKALKPSG